jgi:hypothetical protein
MMIHGSFHYRSQNQNPGLQDHTIVKYTTRARLSAIPYWTLFVVRTSGGEKSSQTVILALQNQVGSESTWFLQVENIGLVLGATFTTGNISLKVRNLRQVANATTLK